MPTIRLPAPLRPYTLGKSEIDLQGETVSAVLDDLITQYPALRPHLLNEQGELRPFVNLFLGENNIRDLQGVTTSLQNEDRLVLIPSIAGGSPLERSES